MTSSTVVTLAVLISVMVVVLILVIVYMYSKHRKSQRWTRNSKIRVHDNPVMILQSSSPRESTRKSKAESSFDNNPLNRISSVEEVVAYVNEENEAQRRLDEIFKKMGSQKDKKPVEMRQKLDYRRSHGESVQIQDEFEDITETLHEIRGSDIVIHKFESDDEMAGSRRSSASSDNKQDGNVTMISTTVQTTPKIRKHNINTEASAPLSVNVDDKTDDGSGTDDESSKSEIKSTREGSGSSVEYDMEEGATPFSAQEIENQISSIFQKFRDDKNEQNDDNIDHASKTEESQSVTDVENNETGLTVSVPEEVEKIETRLKSTENSDESEDSD